MTNKKKKCSMCQAVDDLAPSLSYCAKHDYSNKGMNDTIEKGKRVLCYVCKKPIHIDEMGGVKGNGKGEELWFHTECEKSVHSLLAETRKEERLQIKKIQQDLLVWAGLHRGKGISEECMPRFHEIIDALSSEQEET